jgi:serine/threonine protein kinase
MKGSAEQDRIIAELLEAVVDQDPPDARAFLMTQCRDPEIIDQVLQFLSNEASQHDLLDRPLLQVAREDLEELAAAASTSSADESGEGEEQERLPREVGNYTLNKVLGKGGMGRVYLATQTEPVERTVALKLTKHSLARATFEAMFASERQALARLNHPNIAQMYEAGATEDGHPYFAMELVNGKPITHYCDSRRFSIEDRVQILIDVCHAVQHAHQKQLLHRDLKPSNILVTEVNGKPTPKIIDFGVALSLDEDAQGGTRKQGGNRVGTPGYASPESLALTDQKTDLDTRADIYSLGVVLYELSCGLRPFDGPGITLSEVWERIRKGTPKHPAGKLEELNPPQLRETARLRATRSADLRRTLKSDLDAIVMKAIALDRDDRYGSIAEFSADLQAWLDHKPVTARTQNFTYVARLFVHRNSGLVAAASLLLTAMLVGLVAWSIEAHRANLQAARANHEADQARTALAESEQMSGFLIDLFAQAGIASATGEIITIRDMLDRGRESLEGMGDMEPLNKARVMQAMGEIYTDMNARDEGYELISQALEIRQAVHPPGHWEIAESLIQLGLIKRLQLEFEAAEPLLDRSLDIVLNTPVRDPSAIAEVWSQLGMLYLDQGRTDEAIAAHQNALAIRDIEMAGADSAALAESLNHLGSALLTEREYERARPYLVRAAVYYQELLGDRNNRVAGSAYRLGIVEEYLGNLTRAENQYRRALRVLTNLYGELHRRPITASENLALRLGKWGQPAEGAAEAQLALNARERYHGQNSPEIAPALLTLAGNQILLNDYSAAQASIDRAALIYTDAYGPGHPGSWAAASSLGWLLWNQGEFRQAREQHEAVLGYRLEALGAKHILTAHSKHMLGISLAAQGQPATAEPLLREALEVRLRALGERHADTADTRYHLGLVLWQMGEMQESGTLLASALATRSVLYPPEHPKVQNSWQAIEAHRTGAPPFPTRP